MTFVPPVEVAAVLAAFAPLFSRPTWLRAQVLLCGALLAPNGRTITAALRALGLGQRRDFQNHHRLLNRARWSPLAAARTLLSLLVEAFVPADEPLIFGLDETIERRRGRKIAARAIYRDASRSSAECFQKSSGLRWMSVHLLAPVTWAGRVWALPFFKRPLSLRALPAISPLWPQAQAAGAPGARPHRPGLPLAARSRVDLRR
jgi:hypothetical protein